MSHKNPARANSSQISSKTNHKTQAKSTRWHKIFPIFIKNQAKRTKLASVSDATCAVTRSLTERNPTKTADLTPNQPFFKEKKVEIKPPKAVMNHF
jgi:hypothetical protein